MKLSGITRIWLYGTFSLLFGTGLGWVLLNRSVLLKFHGAAAMVFLVVFGMLLPTHVKKGIAAKKNRASGSLLIGSLAALIVTGYFLYYAGSEGVRTFSSQLHTFLGLASPVVLVAHVLYRYKRKIYRVIRASI